MADFAEAARRARAGVAENDAAAVVRALEPHAVQLQTGQHLGAALDLAWAFGALGRSSEAESLLLGMPRKDEPTRLAVSLARAGWF
jgi:thioredoxin-like negative regulator of GroEL